MINITENKNRFISICKNTIKRDGIDELLTWLEKSDFFTAPASTRYHLNEDGGLCLHSLNVYDRMNTSLDLFTDISEEEISIISLFHDICKVNFYERSVRNSKNDVTGIWEKIPYFVVNNTSGLVGHGDKSARIISKFINITDEEYTAIVYHMGLSSDEARMNPGGVNEVFNSNLLALCLHIADMQATYIDENKDEMPL